MIRIASVHILNSASRENGSYNISDGPVFSKACHKCRFIPDLFGGNCPLVTKGPIYILRGLDKAMTTRKNVHLLTVDVGLITYAMRYTLQRSLRRRRYKLRAHCTLHVPARRAASNGPDNGRFPKPTYRSRCNHLSATHRWKNWWLVYAIVGPRGGGIRVD
jgi:hypothetical protein